MLLGGRSPQTSHLSKPAVSYVLLSSIKKASHLRMTWSFVGGLPVLYQMRRSLESRPQGLVVHLVVELDLGALDQRTQQARAAIGRSLLQIGILPNHFLAE